MRTKTSGNALEFVVDPAEHASRHMPGGADLLTTLEFFNGTFLEHFHATVTSDGATVTMAVQNESGGDLTMNFSDGQAILDCTPAASIELTPGTDTSPQANYIYVLQSTKVLTKSTSDWPDVEHIRVGYFLVPTASLVDTGAAGNNFVYVNQNINDEASTADGQGHLLHIMHKLRHTGATWHSGTEGTATQDGNDLWVDIAAGVIYQIHVQAFAALDSDTAGAGDPILVVNDPDNAYTVVNSLNEITKLSDGSAIGVNKYVKFVLWAVANKHGEVSPMMLNLPGDEYNSVAGAAADVEGVADFSFPSAFIIGSTTGFLVAAFVCKHTATAMEIEQTIDLRGQFPQTEGLGGSVPGGGDVTAAAALTDHAVVRGDGGAKGVQDSGVLIDDAGVMYVDNLQEATPAAGIVAETVRLRDGTIGLQDLIGPSYVVLRAGSALSVDRFLNLVTGDAARTITLSGNPTLADWFDQSVKSGTSPTFDGTNFTGIPTAGVVAALKTESKVLYVQEPTDADDFPMFFTPHAITITKAWGQTDVGTITFQLKWRAVTSPGAGGANILTAAMVADNTGENTTAFADATIPAESWIIYDSSAEAATPGKLWIALKYTVD